LKKKNLFILLGILFIINIISLYSLAKYHRSSYEIVISESEGLDFIEQIEYLKSSYDKIDGIYQTGLKIIRFFDIFFILGLIISSIILKARATSPQKNFT